jgi:dihydrolipoamide dehydrogenase
MKQADVVVIGGGPGGYVCAIRAAQLGLSTVVVEKDRMGGECLNYGCIPSKSIITVSKLFDKVKNGAKIGLKVSDVSVDFTALQEWKRSVVSTLVTGVERLCRGYGAEIIIGSAEISQVGRVTVRTTEGAEEIQAKNIVVATGTKPIVLRGLEFDGKLVIGSKEALELQEAPKRLMVVGGGAIGLELGSLYQRFGSKLIIVELMDQLLPGTDIDLVRVVQKNVQGRGAEIHLQSRVVSVDRSGKSAKVVVETPEGKLTIETDVVLSCVGRTPRTEGLGLQNLGVEVDMKGFIKTDQHMRTNVPGIYAIGDVRGAPLLAHKASKEGIVAAEHIAGLASAADWLTIPNAIFTDPEIATAGMSEKEARESGRDTKSTRFSFAALGRALAAAEPEGFVKVISDAKNGLVLGVQIVGPEASDLISEAALAIEMGATVEDLALTIHPHPTFPEAIMEASEVASGKPIHQLRT